MDARKFSCDITWHFPHWTPRVSQQKLLSEQNVSRSATELVYIRRSVHHKVVSTKSKLTFELRAVKELDVPFFSLVRFMLRQQFLQKTHENDRLYQPSVSNAQYIIGKEKYSDVGIISD